jgi:multidrug efflux pump
VLGVIPLNTASGAGAAARFSMGLVIASGMAIGTVFTLFVVPMFYTYLASDKRPAADAEAAESHGETLALPAPAE